MWATHREIRRNRQYSEVTKGEEGRSGGLVVRTVLHCCGHGSIPSLGTANITHCAMWPKGKEKRKKKERKKGRGGWGKLRGRREGLGITAADRVEGCWERHACNDVPASAVCMEGPGKKKCPFLTPPSLPIPAGAPHWPHATSSQGTRAPS